MSRWGKAMWPDLIFIRLLQRIKEIKYESKGFMLPYPHLGHNREILLILKDPVLFRLKIAIY